jgi:hypothetical protein
MDNFILSDELVNFLLVVLSCSSSQLTIAWLIDDVRVSILLTLLEPTQAFPYTPQSRL